MKVLKGNYLQFNTPVKISFKNKDKKELFPDQKTWQFFLSKTKKRNNKVLQAEGKFSQMGRWKYRNKWKSNRRGKYVGSSQQIMPLQDSGFILWDYSTADLEQQGFNCTGPLTHRFFSINTVFLSVLSLMIFNNIFSLGSLL